MGQHIRSQTHPSVPLYSKCIVISIGLQSVSVSVGSELVQGRVLSFMAPLFKV